MPSDPFHWIADRLPEPMALVTTAGRFICANPPFCADASQSEKELIGQGLADFVENSGEFLLRFFNQCARSNAPVTTRLIWKKRRTNAPTRYHGYLIIDKPGGMEKPGARHPQRSILLRRIQDHQSLSQFNRLNQQLDREKQSNQRLRKRQSALEKEHEKVVVTLRSIGDGVMTTDASGLIEHFNQVAQQISGWSEEEVRGKNLHEVFIIYNEITREPVANPVDECFATGKIVNLSNHTVLKTKDGREIAIEDSAAPIQLPGGEMLGAVLVFRDVTKNRLVQQQLQYLAQHDLLTGLNNRYYFESQLSKAVKIAKRGETEFVLLYIDLDQFKIINDTSGHSAGDQVIVAVAQKLIQRLRQEDTVARIGGDEFGVLLSHVDVKRTGKVARDLQKAIADLVFTWDGRDFRICASIGVCHIDAETSSPAEALRRADVACYVAKNEGRNRVRVYDQSFEQALMPMQELTTINDIRQAMRDDVQGSTIVAKSMEGRERQVQGSTIVAKSMEGRERQGQDLRIPADLKAMRGSSAGFRLHFQPIVDAQNGETIMHEVLLRMQKAEQLALPVSFLPAADRHGLMPEIDIWVLTHATQFLKARPNTVLTINLSGSTLNEPGYLQRISELIQQSSVNPAAIVLEITETEAIALPEKTGQFIAALRQQGCRFALDDFGTGFSSLAYLKWLPVDYIKIDGIFVRDIVDDPTDRALVRSVVQVAHSLGKKTIAEFVEKETILRCVQDLGVDYVQGYYLGVPAGQLLAADSIRNPWMRT